MLHGHGSSPQMPGTPRKRTAWCRSTTETIRRGGEEVGAPSGRSLMACGGQRFRVADQVPAPALSIHVNRWPRDTPWPGMAQGSNNSSESLRWKRKTGTWSSKGPCSTSVIVSGVRLGSKCIIVNQPKESLQKKPSKKNNIGKKPTNTQSQL